MSNISVFPAHAGMIPWLCRPAIPASCVPRACGDDPQLRCTMIDVMWCSPRMRG